MASFEAIPQLNGTVDSLESDYSIIPEMPMMNGNIVTNGSVSTDLHSAMLSATPDLSLEELHSRLIDVCQDNASLKEKMKYSNDVMDRNLKTIKEWHNRVTDSMSQQQMELKEAEEKVARLEKENTELLAKVKELESRSKNVVDCGTSVRDDAPITDEDIDFEIVNRKKLKKKDNEKETEETEQKIANLMKRLEYKQEMFAELEKQYSNEAVRNRFLELPGELLEFLEKLSDLGSTLIYENFQPQGENKKKHYSEVTKLYQERLSFYRILCCKVFQQMKEKMDDMEISLKRSEADLEEEKAKHLDTQKIYHQVQINYDRVTKLLQMESKEKKEKTSMNSEVEMDTKMYLEQIDKITTQLFENEKKLIDTEKKLSEKEKEVEGLTLEINKLKKDVETLPLMESQLLTYEADLNSVMLARDVAEEDINRLRLQLKECSNCGASPSSGEGFGKRRSKKVISPLALARKGSTKSKSLTNDKERWQRIVENVGNQKKTTGEAKPIEVLHCPICGTGYSDIQALQKHVDLCLERTEID